MKIKIVTKGFRLSLPLIPVRMIGFAVLLLPESMFRDMRENTPEPYASLITKENISTIAYECIDIIRENRGLEVVHVETSDGTFVSIRL